MLELYQFPHSAFCLKVRMALKAKHLDYKVIDVAPGIGQINIFRLSGQRQLPVLVDEENIIFDSTEIIEYLDKKYDGPKLIPAKAREAVQAHLIEDWADTTLAKATRAELLKAASDDKTLLITLLPNEIPIQVKKLASNLPCELFNEFANFINHEQSSKLLTSLEELAKLVKENKWIVGESMSIADISIAAQLSLIKFPPSSGSNLSGKGGHRFSHNPKLNPLFQWRDKLDLDLMQPDQVLN